MLVPRERPLSILRSGEGRTLTLVDAPAGAGKTTAVAQWLVADADRLPSCWFSVDSSDNDTTRFWTYAIMAVREVIPGFGAASLAALGGGADVSRFVLPPLINELAAADLPLAVAIDDYHLIRNPAIHAQVEQLLDHLPAGVQVVISTRVDPPLPLSRWRGRGQLAELRAADLRFSDGEAAALLERMQLDVGAGDVEQLVERTEGWAAGLSLAGLSMSGRDDASGFVQEFAGTDRHVLDYLGAEVLAGLTPEAQRFLVQSSALPRLSGPLCDATLQRRGSARLLEELERSNAFVVPLGDTREWYRLHHLLAEVLQSELRADYVDLVPTLHRRASAWFAGEHMTFEAIEHAVEARDATLVADLLSPVSLAYQGGGQVDTVRSWLERLGEEAVAADARLCLIAGTGQIVLGDDPEASRWLERAEAVPFTGPLPGGPASIEAGVATVRGVVTSGRLSQHLKAGRKAVDLERHDSTIWRDLACGGLATALYWSGDREAARPYIEVAASSPLPLLAAGALGILGMMAVDDGDPAAADHHASEGEKLGEEHQLATSPPYGRILLVRGRTHFERGSLAASVTSLEAAAVVLRPGPYPMELADALLWLARAKQRADSADSAQAALGEARLVLEDLPELGVLAERWEAAERELSGEPPTAAAPVPLAVEELSAREHDVLRLLPTALSEAQIGQELFISYHTVHSHVRTIYRKLGTTSRAQTVERARATGLLPAALSHRADGVGRSV